jgi:hypothetical protein
MVVRLRPRSGAWDSCDDRNETLKRKRQHYRANRLDILERKRQDRLKNPRKYRAQDRKYREANRDRRNAYMVQYRLAKKRDRA